MRNWFKKEWLVRSVRMQHRDMQDHAIEGLWLGMVDGHYHLTAARLITPEKVAFAGDLFVPAQKVIFLEVIAADAS